MLIEEIYKPDGLWEVFNIKNKEEFNANYSLTGKFHENVPEDIVKEFKTVIYLFAFSYYHTQFLDEAVTKSLVIIEMAIKLKARELSVPLKRPKNKRGIQYEKKLSILINEVLLKTNLLYLKDDFDRARSIRNSKLHKDSHTFMGTIGFPLRNVKSFMNLINRLFLKESVINRISLEQERVQTFFNKIKNELCVLEYNNTKILIDKVYGNWYVEDGTNKILNLLVNPIRLKAYEYFTAKTVKESLVISFKDYNFINKRVEGFDLNNKPIKLYINDNSENNKTYEKYKNEVKDVTDSDMNVYLSMICDDAAWRIEEVIYENCWNK